MAAPDPTRLATIYVLCDSRIADPIARVRYVGRTVKPVAARLRRHKHDANVGRIHDRRSLWWRSVVAGGGSVTLEVIAQVSIIDMHAAEVAAIATYRSLGCDLTNSTEGGGGILGYRPSAATREKLRLSHLGKQSHLGHRHTVETRARLRALSLGVRPSAETRHKMSESAKAVLRDPAVRERRRQGRLGHVASPEARANMSKARRGEGCAWAKFTSVQVAAIRERYAAGERQSHLAREFQCAPATMHAIVHGRTWKLA